MDKKELHKLAGIQLNESNSYSMLVDQVIAYLKNMQKMSGDSPEQLLQDFERTLVHDLVRDVKQRFFMNQR